MSEERDEERRAEDGEERGAPRGARARLRGLAHRLLDEQPINLSSRDIKELLGAVLGASDKARTEAVRLLGREVRTWLEGLGVAEGVHYLLTNYSLDVSASISLKPLKDKPLKDARDPEEPPSPPKG